MAKMAVKQTTRTEMDINTGELRRVVSEDVVGFVDQEPDYIKVYVGTQLCLNNLDPNLAPAIIAFGKHMTFANSEKNQHVIYTNELVRKDVANELGCTERRVKQLITKLVENGIFIPFVEETEKDGVITKQKKRGIYFVNPWVIAKGSWKDIKQLRQQIDFVKGTTSYVIEDGLGKKEIKVALPERIGKQLTLADLQEGADE